MSGWQFDFRPASYWGAHHAIFANIKGANRRRAIWDAINGGRLEGLPAGLLADGLPDEAREFLGALHPVFMGGEYLPATQEHEVEIARISYDSVTADVTSIRARPMCGRIGYRIVDEYDWEYGCRPAWSRRPLTFRQLIRLIDTAEDVGNGYQGLVTGLWEYTVKQCGGHPAERMRAIVTSEFYPNLERWYDEVAKQWDQEQNVSGQPPH